jgi:hypothetical protein
VDPKDPQGRTNGQIVAAQFVYLMKQGSIRACNEYLDRKLGKPAQSLTLDANLNVTREQRTARLAELLATFPALPDANEHSDDAKPN